MAFDEFFIERARVLLHVRVQCLLDRRHLRRFFQVFLHRSVPVLHDGLVSARSDDGLRREVYRLILEFPALAFPLTCDALLELALFLLRQVFHDGLRELFLRFRDSFLPPPGIRLHVVFVEQLLAARLRDVLVAVVEGHFLDLFLRGDHTRHDALHRQGCVPAVARERLVNDAQELLEPPEHSPQPPRRGLALAQVELERAREALLPPLTLEPVCRVMISGRLRIDDSLLTLPELPLPGRPLVLLRRTLLPVRPGVDELQFLLRYLVNLCEVFEIHEEHVAHLVEKRRLVRLLKQRDHAPPVRVRRDIALPAAVFLLIETSYFLTIKCYDSIITMWLGHSRVQPFFIIRDIPFQHVDIAPAEVDGLPVLLLNRSHNISGVFAAVEICIGFSISRIVCFFFFTCFFQNMIQFFLFQ